MKYKLFILFMFISKDGIFANVSFDFEKCCEVSCLECNGSSVLSTYNGVNISMVENIFVARKNDSKYICDFTLFNVKEIELEQFKNLRSLSISHLGLQSLSFTIEETRQYNITKLDASYNNLRFCDLRYLPLLIAADFAFNVFDNLVPKYFNDSSSIETLNFSSNKINYTENGTFFLLTSLQVLDLSNNNISSFDQDFSPNKNLKHLNLRNNTLTSFTYSTFSPDAGLIQVNLAGNDLVKLDISCRNEKCHFDDLDDDAFFENLLEFNASGNHLTNIPQLLQKIGSKLTKMDLSINNIEQVEKNMFNRFNQLLNLNLSHSNISDIAPDSFLNQTQLITLDLSHNNLTKIEENLFRMILNLAVLNLEGNKLMNIHGVISMKLSKLTELAISNNQIDCQTLYDFLKLLKNVTLVRNNQSEKINVNGVDCKLGKAKESDKKCEGNSTNTIIANALNVSNEYPIQNITTVKDESWTNAYLIHLFIGIVELCVGMTFLLVNVYYYRRCDQEKTENVYESVINLAPNQLEEAIYEEIPFDYNGGGDQPGNIVDLSRQNSSSRAVSPNPVVIYATVNKDRKLNRKSAESGNSSENDKSSAVFSQDN